MSSKHSFLLRVALLTREAAPVTTVVRPGDLKEAGLIIVKPGNYRELTRHRDFTRQSRKLLGPKPRPHGRRPPHDLRAIDSRGRGGGAVAARARANRPDRRRARGLCHGSRTPWNRLQPFFAKNSRPIRLVRLRPTERLESTGRFRRGWRSLDRGNPELHVTGAAVEEKNQEENEGNFHYPMTPSEQPRHRRS